MVGVSLEFGFVSIFKSSRLYALQIPYSKQINMKDVCWRVGNWTKYGLESVDSRYQHPIMLSLCHSYGRTLFHPFLRVPKCLTRDTPSREKSMVAQEDENFRSLSRAHRYDKAIFVRIDRF